MNGAAKINLFNVYASIIFYTKNPNSNRPLSLKTMVFLSIYQDWNLEFGIWKLEAYSIALTTSFLASFTEPSKP